MNDEKNNNNKQPIIQLTKVIKQTNQKQKQKKLTVQSNLIKCYNKSKIKLKILTFSV